MPRFLAEGTTTCISKDQTFKSFYRGTFQPKIFEDVSNISWDQTPKMCFVKQCHSLKNHRELGISVLSLVYMVFSFLVLIWSPTWSITPNIYPYTYRCSRKFHTSRKFDVFLNKKCLQLIPLIGKAGKQFVIKLHPCLSVGTFKPQRFSPKKNNVRQNWFNGKEGVAEDGAGRLQLYNLLLAKQPVSHF